MRTVPPETQEQTLDHSDHAHAVHIFQAKTGTLRYAGSTHGDGQSIAHHRAPGCAAFTHSRRHRDYAERKTSTQTLRTRFAPDSAGPVHTLCAGPATSAQNVYAGRKNAH